VKVYRVDLRSSFYVLAADDIEAKEAARVACLFDEIEACLPTTASPSLDVQQTINQSDYMREKCENYEPRVHGSAQTGTGEHQ
jgi:hypothetical protein